MLYMENDEVFMSVYDRTTVCIEMNNQQASIR